jgi:5-methylcytosine-specific restriction endonuclease McrA
MTELRTPIYYPDADYAVTLQSDEIDDLDHIDQFWFWSGWRNRHWPAHIIRRGLRLYGFDKERREFVVVLEVTRGGSFEYRTLREYARIATRLTGWNPENSNPHWHRLPQATNGRPCTGFALRWRAIKRTRLPWPGRFPQLGWLSLLGNDSSAACVDLGNPFPGRAEIKVSRVIRDTRLTRYLKRLHNHVCQLCETRIRITRGVAYAEGHHLRPLGEPHNGPDIAENVIIVCPNCHAKLDFLAMPLVNGRIRKVRGHDVGKEYVRYHNSLVQLSVT